jgi:glutaredoxin
MNRLLLIACATLLAGPALAQYKVVGPDGRVTYTDRPPTGAQGQVSAVRRDGSLGPATSGTQLPLELRQVAARFPVVIYTAPECQLCDSARQLLKLRGIPMTERQALHFEDLSIVERQTGGRSLPAITVGAQGMNGFGESQWNALLDLAGYPRESKLPRDYVAANPVPLSKPAAAPAAAAAAAPRPTAPDVGALPTFPEPTAPSEPPAVRF